MLNKLNIYRRSHRTRQGKEGDVRGAVEANESRRKPKLMRRTLSTSSFNLVFSFLVRCIMVQHIKRYNGIINQQTIPTVTSSCISAQFAGSLLNSCTRKKKRGSSEQARCTQAGEESRKAYSERNRGRNESREAGREENIRPSGRPYFRKSIFHSMTIYTLASRPSPLSSPTRPAL